MTLLVAFKSNTIYTAARRDDDKKAKQSPIFDIIKSPVLFNSGYWQTYRYSFESLISDINAKTIDSGRTVLMEIIENGKDTVQTVDWLIKNGANIMDTSDDGSTALHVAAKKDDLLVAILLIRAGANIDNQDDYGFSALHLTAAYDSHLVARLLINKDANLHLRDNDGKLPIDHCKLANDYPSEKRKKYLETYDIFKSAIDKV